MIESIKSMITNDSIQVISIIMPVWITFSIYLFNYSLKWSLGKIEIENNENDKLIPLSISIIFIFFTFLGGSYAYSLNNNSTTDLIAMCSLLVMLIILLVIYFNKLNKSNKVLVCKKTLGCNHICKIAFIFIMNIIVGIFIGFDAIYIIKNAKDLHSIIFGIGSFIWIYYLTLMTSGLIFCETILSTLKLYELEYNEENIQCYLIGVFNDFLKIRDSKKNIRLINKDQIKEIREIDKVSVKNGEKINKPMKPKGSSGCKENKEKTYLVKVKDN